MKEDQHSLIQEKHNEKCLTFVKINYQLSASTCPTHFCYGQRWPTAPFKHRLFSYPSLKFKSLVFQALRLTVQSDLIHQNATKTAIFLWPTLDRHIFVELPGEALRGWVSKPPELSYSKPVRTSHTVIHLCTSKASFPAKPCGVELSLSLPPSPVYPNWCCWVYNGVCYKSSFPSLALVLYTDRNLSGNK